MSCEKEAKELEDAKAELAKAQVELQAALAAAKAAQENVQGLKDISDAAEHEFPRDRTGNFYADAPAYKAALKALEAAEGRVRNAQRAFADKETMVRLCELALKACLDFGKKRQGGQPKPEEPAGGGTAPGGGGGGAQPPAPKPAPKPKPPKRLSRRRARIAAAVAGVMGTGAVVGGIFWLNQPPPRPPAPPPAPLTVSSISSTFDAITAVTTYKVSATSSTGRQLTYTWSKVQAKPCGSFKGTRTTATWFHPDANRVPKGDCDSEPVHKADISVVVDDGRVECTALFPYGSDVKTGPTPNCPGPPTRPVIQQGTWWFGLDRCYEPWALIAGGGILVIGSGVVLWLGRSPECRCLDRLLGRRRRLEGDSRDDIPVFPGK